MAIKIEKNIPAPETRGRRPQYEIPWDDMKVGDSFLFEGSVSTIHRSAKAYGVNMVTKRTEEGIRVWFKGFIQSNPA